MRILSAALLCGALLLPPSLARAEAEPGHAFAPSLAGIYVAEIQRQLVQRGYLAGVAVGGRVDAATAAAIRAFQRDVGLPVTGLADLAVINMLNFGPPTRAATAAVAAPPPAAVLVVPPPAEADDTPPPQAAPRPPVEHAPLPPRAQLDT